MKFSAKTDYALKIIYYMATHPEIISAKEIVENSGVPKSLGLRIITELVHGKILKSFSKKNGGVFLNNTLENITLFDVINNMEEIFPKKCIDDEEINNFKDSDLLKEKMLEVTENFIASLKSITFSQILENKKYKSN